MWSKHLALGYTGLILLLTLSPDPTGTPEELLTNFCLVCGGKGGSDGILNFLLFLPLGFALIVAGGRPRSMTALVVVIPIVIELLQTMIPGRYPTLADVVYNAFGGGAGIGLAAVRKQLFRPSPRLAGALTLGTGAVAATLLVLAGILLAPSFPATIYYGQWTADLLYMEAYEGQVLEASLGPMFLGSERTENPELAVDLLRSGAPLEVRAVAGPAPRTLAPIVSILDESRVEILVLGADATDLVLRVRYRADDFRLVRPDLRARGAFAATRPGNTIRLRAERTPEGYTLWLDQQAYGPLRHTPGEGWALLLHPEHTAPWVDSALNAAWVAGLLILAGWWAPGLGWALGALSLALTGMVMAAVTGPLTEIAPVEILAAIVGVMLGLVLRRLWARGSHYQPNRLMWHYEKRSTDHVLMIGAESGIING